jgi:aryl-alcohol dehydrogenase-like predicted oxidoreductase
MRLRPEPDGESFALLDRYRSAGGNVYDTAEIYGGGESERALGLYFAMRGGRDDAIIVSKGCVEPHLVRPDYIRAAIDRSLERLRMDSIDLYLLHRDDPSVPVGELIDVLNEAVRQGKVRAFGGSNWTTARFEAANRYARERSLRAFTASSPHLALAVPREPWWAGCNHATETDLKWYAREGMPLLAWSSQCRGFFSKVPIADIAYMADVVRVYYTTPNLERRERLMELATQRGLDPAALAVAYVTSLPLTAVALVGPLSVADLERALTVSDLTLEPEVIRWLESGRRNSPA